MGKQQTKHSLPHSANSVDTANESNRFYARFDVGTSVRSVPHCARTARPFWGDLVTSLSPLNSHSLWPGWTER